MPIDRSAFIGNYLDELKDYIGQIDDSILKLKNDPENEEELNRLLRALHTVKGSSRMLKFNIMEKISHGLENVFKGVKDGRYNITDQVVKLVFVTTDHLRNGAIKISKSSSDTISADDLLEAFNRACSNEPFDVDNLKAIAIEELAEVTESVEVEAPAANLGKEAVSAGPAVKEKIKKVESAPTGEETIRIKISRIDKINKMFNDLIVKQFQFKKGHEHLKELEDSFSELTSLKNKIQANDKKALLEFTQRENQCLKLIKGIHKNFTDEFVQLERSSFDVQEEIYSLSMRPLELIIGPLAKMTAETAMSLGKEVKFRAKGTDIMIDKVILEHIQDPIIHLVRNAIDHGIERPAERTRKGKIKTGRVYITCTSESGKINISIKDDGKGLDYRKILKRACGIDPLLQQTKKSVTKAQLNSYLFMPGFSTQEEVSDLSGRGVGLDIVKHNIEEVKGKITLRSRKNVGTEIILSLPVTLSTVNGFFITSGGEKFLIPATFVKEIVLYEEKEMEIGDTDRQEMILEEKTVPVFYLSDILDKGDHAEKGNKFAVVVESFGETIGVLVDSIVQYASLIYKPLPACLSGCRALQGVVFDEHFSLISILYMPEIITRLKSIGNIRTKRRYSTDKIRYKSILLVDDSYTTRDIAKSILETEDYNVITAVDGIDGLAKLNERHFNLIITDIKMPRMDGITFVENIRRDHKSRSIPIVVLSAVKDDEMKKKVMIAGANAYIVKSDFDRDNLLNAVEYLMDEG